MPKKEHTACDHCGALVFPDTKRCNQCGKFPVKLHLCPGCKTIGAKEDTHCHRCGKMYDPEGDYL